VDIDQFFTLGPGVQFRANRVFTDREAYLAAVHERAVQHTARVWPVPLLLNFQRPAGNVVAFAGEGGIGKSTLARHAAHLAVEGNLPGLPEDRACAVIDFADPSSQSFETIMLRMRASLAKLGNSWPAFDVALAVYWERKHPGESLVRFLKKSSLSESLRVSDQVGTSIDQFLGGGLGAISLAYRALELLSRSTVQASKLKRLRRELPALEPILAEEDPDRMLGYMPVLLAADLERVREKKPTLVICLLDTFENVQSLPTERGGLEDLVARLV
jgi:energy-coupling factor transporter ATP-binding protein EcfA2